MYEDDLLHSHRKVSVLVTIVLGKFQIWLDITWPILIPLYLSELLIERDSVCVVF